jgi:hypothetical protein
MRTLIARNSGLQVLLSRLLKVSVSLIAWLLVKAFGSSVLFGEPDAPVVKVPVIDLAFPKSC